MSKQTVSSWLSKLGIMQCCFHYCKYFDRQWLPSCQHKTATNFISQSNFCCSRLSESLSMFWNSPRHLMNSFAYSLCQPIHEFWHAPLLHTLNSLLFLLCMGSSQTCKTIFSLLSMSKGYFTLFSWKQMPITHTRWLHEQQNWHKINWQPYIE